MKNYAGQRFTANLIKEKEGIGGIMAFYDNRLEFEAFFEDQLPQKLVIPYGEIEKVAAVMTCGLIPNGLNLWMEDGELLRFSIWHRKKIAAFLREKAGI